MLVKKKKESDQNLFQLKPHAQAPLYAQELQILCSFCLVKLKPLVPISLGFEEEFVFLSLLPSGFYFFSLSLWINGISL